MVPPPFPTLSASPSTKRIPSLPLACRPSPPRDEATSALSHTPAAKNTSAKKIKRLGRHQQLECKYNISTFPVALYAHALYAYFSFFALSVFAAAAASFLCALLSCLPRSHGTHIPFRHSTESSPLSASSTAATLAAAPVAAAAVSAPQSPQPWLSVAQSTTATTRCRPTTEH